MKPKYVDFIRTGVPFFAKVGNKRISAYTHEDEKEKGIWKNY